MNEPWRRTRRFLRFLSAPPVVISLIGLAGFAIDMLIKPISNAGLILLLAAATPWLLKTVKRLKVGDYIEFENLTLTEAERKLKSEAVELLEDTPAHDPSPDEAFDGSVSSAPDHTTEGPAITAPPPAELLRNLMRHINLSERWVLDWLEGELGVKVRRNVRIGGIELDGVAMTTPAPTLVEIKAIQSVSTLRRRFSAALIQLRRARSEWRSHHSEEPRLLLVLTTNAQPDEDEYQEQVRSVETLESELLPVCDVRVVSITDIAKRQGWLNSTEHRTFLDWANVPSDG